jgi:hypothetical protein
MWWWLPSTNGTTIFQHPWCSTNIRQFSTLNRVLNQYFKNYVNVDQKDWGKHLNLVKFCYNLMIKMSLFKLVLGTEAKKSMDLATPMGWRDHSKEVEMIKRCEE